MSKAENIKRAVFIVVLAVFLFSAAMTVRQQTQYRQISIDRDEAARIAGLPEDGRAPQTSPPAAQAAPDGPLPEPLPEEAAGLLSIDLEALRSVNEDVVGWIAIPGTELSYPLTQGEDNRFYLSHSWKRTASSGGSVFLEAANSRDLSGFHTIIYAHRMRNDSMFGTLKYYDGPDFWRAHPSVYLAVDGGVYRYDVFAAHEVGTKGVIYRLDIEESHLEDELLRACLEGSAIDTGIVPTGEDRILSLSTCTAAGQADRWVVHAVLRAVWAAE